MSSPATLSPAARTWRDIPQTIAPRAMSSTGRKRMMFATSKNVAGAILVLACLWVGYTLFHTWEYDPSKLKAPVKSAVVKNISLRGQNLVLDQPWLVRTLNLPKDADLVELDLFALRDRLMASGQVRAATLTRKFPDTLVVSIEERSPVARVNVRFADAEPETYLVARDGYVYQGFGYKEDVRQSLPFLSGVSLRRVSGRIQPIDGMEQVADLLTTARANVPNLYRNWVVVSLEKYASDGEILVQTTDSGTAVFGTREDFYRQIARLDYILDEAKKNPMATPLKTVNLAVGEQVPVSFEPAPAAENPSTRNTPHSPASRNVIGGGHNATPTNLHPGAAHVPPTRPLQANTSRTHRTSST